MNVLRYTAPVSLACDGTAALRKAIASALNDYTVTDATVLEYFDKTVAHKDTFRGGYLRLKCDTKSSKLSISIEIDTSAELTKEELEHLRKRLDGQMTDGLGAGALDAIADKFGLEIEVLPLESEAKSVLTQSPGNAWLPQDLAEVVKSNEASLLAVERKLTESRSKPKNFNAEVRSLFKQLDKISPFPTAAQLEEFAQAIAGLSQTLDQIKPNSLPFVNYKNPELLRLMLDAKLDPNSKDRDGHTLLYLSTGDVRCLRLLIERGADVNAINDDVYNYTALMQAAGFGEIDALRYLLECGADPTMKTSFGETALVQAKKNTYRGDMTATIQLLKSLQ